MYAYYTCSILRIKATDDNTIMRREIKKVDDWFSSNELLLNFKKTENPYLILEVKS